MQTLRMPFFILALVLIVLVLLVEMGSSAVKTDFSAGDFQAAVADSGVNDASIGQQATQLHQNESPPGLGVPYLALLDGIVVLSMALMAAGVLVPRSLEGRLQGIVTFVFSLLLILGAIVLIYVAIGKLMLMLSLLFSVPFGTLAYIAIFGFFNRGATTAILGVLMLLKLGFGVSLVFAHQRFLQNTGLVLIVLTSLVGNIVVSFLQGVVPILLVSITDDIAAIIVGILAVIWAIVLLIGSIPGILKALRPSAA